MLRFSLIIAVVLSTLLSVGQAQSAAQISMANDLTVLNYALTLEHLEATFYAEGLATFSATELDAVAPNVFNGSTYDMISMIAAHEATHVATLTSVIDAAAKGQAAPNCTYDFTAALSSAGAFIATALALETGGQQAYDGALNGITNPMYAQAAATIATVEARHVAYLSLIQTVPQVPFPSAFDNATMPEVIAMIIAPFIVSCPYNITLPTIRPTGVTIDSTGAVVATGSLSPSYTAAQQTNDIVALNYALTLEHLEASFYNYAVATFTEDDFVAAGFPAYYYNYSLLIQGHENTHVAALTAVITSRGGSAVPNCTYDFSSVSSPAAYFATARILENTGVMAYDGAANTITDTTLQQVAATIVTVEARHAAFLNLANGGSAFPSAFDTATSPNDIIAAVVATGLIVVCPYNLAGPVVITPAALSAPTSVLGDPSFVGFHGQSFQVHGIPNRYFNLLSTSSVQFNALFTMLVDGQSMSAGAMKAARVSRQLSAAKLSKESSSTYPLPLTTAYSHEGTFLAVMALKLAGVAVYAAAGPYTQGFKTVTIAGSAVAVSSAAVEVAAGMYVTLQTPHILTIDTPAVSFTLANADHFFNIEQATLHQHYTADAQMDGLLGQTANEQWKVESSTAFKQHMVYDYLLADMDGFSDDFVSNLYQAPAVDATNEQ